MLTATVLVLMMTIPGLALFYAGLVRAKNVVSMLMQVFAIVCMVAILWVIYGYSLAFTSGGVANDYVGGLSKAFLMGVTPESNVATFSNGVVIPELVYICFQMTFACITPALIVGGVRGAHEVLGPHAVHRPVGHVRLLPHRPHGLVLGRPGRAGRGGQQARPGGRRSGQDGGREGAGRGHRPTPASPSSGAPSTSPAARWCTSTPASPPWSAP